MEDFQQEQTENRGITLAERFKKLERDVKIQKRAIETNKIEKQFRWPFKWKRKLAQTNKPINTERILVFFLNKKNEMEPPRFMPIFDGNMIIWKNKPYEFDPRAVWTVKGMRKNPKAYLIKEIDRRPTRNKFGRAVYKDAAIHNLDVDEIRQRGDSTESDEFLIKAALKAQTTQQRKNANIAVLIIVGLLVVGGVIWFVSGS